MHRFKGINRGVTLNVELQTASLAANGFSRDDWARGAAGCAPSMVCRLGTHFLQAIVLSPRRRDSQCMSGVGPILGHSKNTSREGGSRLLPFLHGQWSPSHSVQHLIPLFELGKGLEPAKGAWNNGGRFGEYGRLKANMSRLSGSRFALQPRW